MSDFIRELIVTDEEVATAQSAIERLRKNADSPFSGPTAEVLEKSLTECIAYRTAALTILDANVDESSEKAQHLIIEMRLAKNTLLKGIQSAD